ncbi:helix-turn-helix domain-containing protein [Streptomyces sp. NPDC002676]
MLTVEEVLDAHALRRQGWSISAIARHLGRDRKTIRAYLSGERAPHQRHQPPEAFVHTPDIREPPVPRRAAARTALPPPPRDSL